MHHNPTSERERERGEGAKNGGIEVRSKDSKGGIDEGGGRGRGVEGQRGEERLEVSSVRERHFPFFFSFFLGLITGIIYS